LSEPQLSYPAIGATGDDAFPHGVPAGFRATTRSARIGDGDARWEFARREVMAWGVKTRSGFRVRANGAMRAGDDATLLLGWGRLSVREPVRVVYLVDEPRRCGFAYGTLPGHPLRGEELFLLERRDDDSVWLVIRAFSRPARPLWWVLSPALRLLQVVFTRRYLRALAVPID
jgi:uncharacterized protein (UPF0548 family)